MFNYFPGGIVDVKPELTISIDILQCLIKNNPQKSIIEEIWASEYKSKQYDFLKTQLPYITPHGSFNTKRVNTCVSKFSGYLYYDIDAKSINCDIEEYKQKVINNFKDFVSMVGKSVGGRGLFFYVKIKNNEKLAAENFNNIYEYYRTEVFKTLPIDNNCKGISRAQFLPYDDKLYINRDISMMVPDYVFNNKVSEYSSCAFQYNNTTTKNVLHCPAHYYQYIDIKDVLKDLKKETYVDVGENDFIIKPIEFMKLYIPRVIKVGNRHSSYRAFINCIVYNNPNFSLEQILSFINYCNYNRTGNNPLPEKEMINTVTHHYNKIKKEGIKGIRKKNIHTNPKLPGFERSAIANQQNGKLKVQTSIKMIEDAVNELKIKNENPTIKTVVQLLKGFRSERTIKKYWRKVVPKI